MLLGPVPPMIVVVPGVGPQHHAEMTLTIDQPLVRAVSSDGLCPAFGITVRRVCGGVFTTRTPALAKTSSNMPVNLASRSRMRNRNGLIRSVRCITQIAGLLNRPCPVRVPSYPELKARAPSSAAVEGPLIRSPGLARSILIPRSWCRQRSKPARPAATRSGPKFGWRLFLWNRERASSGQDHTEAIKVRRARSGKCHYVRRQPVGAARDGRLKA